jgi:hypothetical protein
MSEKNDAIEIVLAAVAQKPRERFTRALALLVRLRHT